MVNLLKCGLKTQKKLYKLGHGYLHLCGECIAKSDDYD